MRGRSPEELDERAERLRRLVHHAFERVPFYRVEGAAARTPTP